MTKQAILVISFGTSYAESEKKSILSTENAVRAAYPDREVRRAYTSRMILKKLNAHGIPTRSVPDAMDALRAEGYTDIVAASTHIIPGVEYEQAAREAGVPISRPLLDTQEDLEWMAALLGGIATAEGRTLLMMGHGTDHAADETYVRLRECLPANVKLACVEGSHTLEEILPELEQGEKRLTLMPLMLVAGDHAHNDLGGDEDDSWRSVLTAKGFDVVLRLQGLGELEEVRARMVGKLKKVID